MTPTDPMDYTVALRACSNMTALLAGNIDAAQRHKSPITPEMMQNAAKAQELITDALNLCRQLPPNVPLSRRLTTDSSKPVEPVKP